MENYISSLFLEKVVFDKIEFNRKGFKNDNEIGFGLQVQIGMAEDKTYKVTLVLTAEKKEEYDISISLSGFFKIDNEVQMQDGMAQDLINKNAVAILMPYLRSELTLLTAQPDTESVVLPPFNINKMLEK